jgi:hypothetical protein
MGTTIDSNLDITIKNKLYDVRTSLYTDYTEYIAIQQGWILLKGYCKESKTEASMGGVSTGLIPTIDQSVDKLNSGINDLSSLDFKFWKFYKVRYMSFETETFRARIKTNIDNLTKYVLVFTNIKDNKITKPDTESETFSVYFVKSDFFTGRYTTSSSLTKPSMII